MKKIMTSGKFPKETLEAIGLGGVFVRNLVIRANHTGPVEVTATFFPTLRDDADLERRDALQPADTHPLQTIFDQCVEQAVSGKGEERHGHGADFMDQPWRQIAETHGLGFLTGQSAKKLDEATKYLQQNPGQDGVAFFQREIRGAINYLAMAMLLVEEEVEELTGCGDCAGCQCGERKGAPMVFDPITGASPFPGPYYPDEYRAHHGPVGPVAWLVNPWTGERRNLTDVGTDPFGHLIAPF